MKKKINATRQELLKLKKQLKTARSGHQLLKNKLDSLIQEFLSRVRQLQSLQDRVRQILPDFLLDYFQAENNLGSREIDALLCHLPEAKLSVRRKNIMGVRVEEYEFANQAEIIEAPFSLDAAGYFLAKARKKAYNLIELLFAYATLEQKIKLLAEEIEQVRRRVNSLEYVYIPEIEQSRKYIMQKLEEKERFERTVLMKLKSRLVQADF